MSVEVAKQLDYSKKAYNHPTYRFSKLLPQSGGTTAVIGAAGGNETIFEIPINAYNLNQSFLRAQLKTGAAANPGYLRLFTDTNPLIRQLQLYTRSGKYLCDINKLSNYLKVAWNAETQLDEFLGYDTQSYASNTALGAAGAQPSLIGSGRLFRRNDALVTAVGAERPTLGAAGSDVNYTEPMYVMRSTLEAGGSESSMTVNVDLPLGMIYNTIFALNKTILPNEILLLRAVWQPRTKVYYKCTNATNADTGAAAADADVNIANIGLFLAVEQNQDIINQLRSQISSGGMSILVPYVYTYKTNLGVSTSQNVSLRFNRGNGRRLKKIYHSLFNNTESSNTAYDHSNDNAGRVTNYYTLLNNNRLQEYNLDCTQLDDYYLLRKQLKGTVIQTAAIFTYNWFHLEDFTGMYEDNDNPEKDNLETGLPLELEQKWDIYLTTASAAYNHYSFAVTEKMLTISSAGIDIL